MTEGKEHIKLKAYARQILQKMGFETQEIFEEYTIKYQGMRDYLIVDVAGISTIRKVAIECGITPADKVLKLQLYFDEVLLLPYFADKVSTLFCGNRQKLIKKVVKQEKEIAFLRIQLNLQSKPKESNYRILASEHTKIINIRQNGESIASIAKAINRSTKTIYHQILLHNEEVESKGFCGKCQKLNNQWADQIISLKAPKRVKKSDKFQMKIA